MKQTTCERVAPMYSPRWHARQTATIGGSSAAAAVNQSRYTSRRELFERLRSALNGDTVDEIVETPDMRRGRLLERVAIQRTADVLRMPIEAHDQCEFVYTHSMRWAHALPDGFIGKPGDSGRRLVEVKVPRPATIAACLAKGLRAEWILQAQHNMAVTGARAAVVGLLDPITCDAHVFDVQADSDVQQELLAAELSLWEAIETGKYEPWQGDTVCAALSDQLADDADAAAAVPIENADAAKLCRALLEAKDLAADADEAVEAARERLGAIIGAHELVRIVGVDYQSERTGKSYYSAVVHYRAQKGSRRFNAAVAQVRYPELKGDEFYKLDKPSRPMRIYPCVAR